MTTIYIDFIGGKYEAWCHSEGRRSVLAVHYDRYDCVKIATRNSGYQSHEVQIVYTAGARRLKPLAILILFASLQTSVVFGQDRSNLDHDILLNAMRFKAQADAAQRQAELKEARTDLEREAVEAKFAIVPILPPEGDKRRLPIIKSLSPAVRKAALSAEMKRKADRQRELAKMTPDDRKAAIESDRHHYDDLLAALKAVEERLAKQPR